MEPVAPSRRGQRPGEAGFLTLQPALAEARCRLGHPPWGFWELQLRAVLPGNRRAPACQVTALGDGQEWPPEWRAGSQACPPGPSQQLSPSCLHPPSLRTQLICLEVEGGLCWKSQLVARVRGICGDSCDPPPPFLWSGHRGGKSLPLGTFPETGRTSSPFLSTGRSQGLVGKNWLSRWKGSDPSKAHASRRPLGCP